MISYTGYQVEVLLFRNHLRSLLVGCKTVISWEHTTKPRGKGWNYFPKGYAWEPKFSFSVKSFPSSETQNRKTKPYKRFIWLYASFVSINLYNICVLIFSFFFFSFFLEWKPNQKHFKRKVIFKDGNFMQTL